MSASKVVSLSYEDLHGLPGLTEYPYHMVGAVIYREDYSDLGEPFLTAVKRAERRIARARGLDVT